MHIRTFLVVLSLFAALLAPSPALAVDGAEVEAPRAEPAARGGAREDRGLRGLATWYGPGFQGSLMANGVPYDMTDPGIAASNVYPLGTMLRVTRVATGENIVVKVSDRGAFRDPILVDLSHAAFSRLADTDEGVIRVVVEPVD